MGKFATPSVKCGSIIYLLIMGTLAHAQSFAGWRQVGNWVVNQSLAGPAGGPVARVWYSADGTILYAQTQTGHFYRMTDLAADSQHWQSYPSAVLPLPPADFSVLGSLPENGAHVRAVPGKPGRLYAFHDFVYRSDDGGRHWEDTTLYRGKSIVGPVVHDLAVAMGAESSQEEVVVATDAGVFRSADGGTSWSGLNETLPNFPATRLLSLPSGGEGVHVALTNDSAAQWEPGQKTAWIPANNLGVAKDTALRRSLARLLNDTVTAAAIAGDFIYAGTQSGVISVSADSGATWRSSASYAGPVERFWVDPTDPRVALAVQGAAPPNVFRTTAPPHVVRTLNSGAFWDDITGNLPDAAAHGIVADRASHAVYVATDQGVFMSYTDLGTLAQAAAWTKLEIAGQTDSPALDVMLDAPGNQLWVALEGNGIYAALAPHRLRDPKVVSAADMIAHALAPGSLISVLGAKLESVRAGGSAAAVLAATATGTEVQIPFNVQGPSLDLSATVGTSTLSFPSQSLSDAAPVIFVSADGSPMLVNADEGSVLDAGNPVHPGTRVQILATGLGKITPEWPAGVPAPMENPPRVIAPVRAFIDRVPVTVNSATLAPGYAGFYLIEVEIPKAVNYGVSELMIDAGGVQSNAVRIYIEP